MYKGIEVYVAYWFESSFIQQAEDFDSEWPYWRGYFSTLITLYERDNWTRHLKPALEKADKADADEAIREEALYLIRKQILLEHDLSEGDSREIRASCSGIAFQSSNLLLLLNRQPQDPNQFWKAVFNCSIKPADFEHLVDLATGFAPADAKAMTEAALSLVEEMLEMVRQRGIQLESAELHV